MSRRGLTRRERRIFIRAFVATLSCMAACVLLFVSLNIEKISTYLQDADKAVNSFTIGSNEIEVTENFGPPGPGPDPTVKEAIAKNIGRVDCYIRCKVVLSDSRVGEYLTYYYKNGSSYNAGFRTSKWKDGGDGWYYYTDEVAPGNTAQSIFSHIKLDEAIPDIYKGFGIDVIFESVQVNDFSSAQVAFDAMEKGGGN